MMGEHADQSNFYYNITLEQFVPSDHPLRAIRPLIDAKAIRRVCRSLYLRSDGRRFLPNNCSLHSLEAICWASPAIGSW